MYIVGVPAMVWAALMFIRFCLHDNNWCLHAMHGAWDAMGRNCYGIGMHQLWSVCTNLKHSQTSFIQVQRQHLLLLMFYNVEVFLCGGKKVFVKPSVP